MTNSVIKVKDTCIAFEDVVAVAPSVFPVSLQEKDDEDKDVVNTYSFPAINVYFKAEPNKPLVLTYSSVEERDHYYMEILGLININAVCADYAAPTETEEKSKEE